MKRGKPLFLLVALPLLGGLFSCQGNETVNKVDLAYGALFDEEATGNGIFSLNRVSGENGYYYSNYLPYSSLLAKITDKDSFILIVQAEGEECLCWTSWRELLSAYMKEHNVEMHLITEDVLAYAPNDGETRAESLGITLNGENSLLIFDQGKLAYQEFAPLDSKFFSSYKYLDSYLDERISMPRMLSLTNDQLDALYAGEDDFYVYFGRSSCSDCAYFESAYLDSFLKEDDGTYYYLDCDSEGIRYYQGVEPQNEAYPEYAALAETQWAEFKAEYGLAYGEDNPTGYGTGVVPTMMRISPDGNSHMGDVIASYAVYMNDEYSLDGDTLNITGSYYSSKRLSADPDYLDYLGETTPLDSLSFDGYLSSGYSTAYSYYREKIAPYYETIFDSFLK